jgi:hypothetical protein
MGNNNFPSFPVFIFRPFSLILSPSNLFADLTTIPHPYLAAVAEYGFGSPRPRLVMAEGGLDFFFYPNNNGR